MAPATCSTRRWMTKLAPTRIAMPTVCSVSTVGYVQIESDPSSHSVNALFCRLRKNATRLLHVVFRARDVVVQARAIRTNRIEQRNALRPVLHRMSDEPDRIADFVAGARPPLPRHDVDRTPFDVPSADHLRIDARRPRDVNGEVDVRVLPLPFRNDALIRNVLVHLEHRERMVRCDGDGRERQTDEGEPDPRADLHVDLHSDTGCAIIS